MERMTRAWGIVVQGVGGYRSEEVGEVRGEEKLHLNLKGMFVTLCLNLIFGPFQDLNPIQDIPKRRKQVEKYFVLVI